MTKGDGIAGPDGTRSGADGSAAGLPRARAGEVDAQVGARVRYRRQTMGISQERLADGLGVSFQQVQKYERGANRISASRLQAIGQILDVPVSYFFEAAESDGSADNAAELLLDRSAVRLLRAFRRLRSPRHRQAIIDVAEAMVGFAEGFDAEPTA